MALAQDNITQGRKSRRPIPMPKSRRQRSHLWILQIVRSVQGEGRGLTHPFSAAFLDNRREN
jgi:hypothetical protein